MIIFECRMSRSSLTGLQIFMLLEDGPTLTGHETVPGPVVKHKRRHKPDTSITDKDGGIFQISWTC